MIGKVSPSAMRDAVFRRTGAQDPAVIQGPAYGEDTAAVDLGDQILVVNADPLSLAAEHVGTLAVHVVCNDIAASGARPRWVTNTMFLPDDDPATIEAVTSQFHEAAKSMDVAIVGGHTEYHDAIERPLLSLTAFGLTDRYVPTGGGAPGDTVVLTGTAGIEGTAILASDFADQLREEGVPNDIIEQAATFIDRISVVDIGIALGNTASGMHDPTEGGVLAGLVEMASAAEHRFDIDPSTVPIASETMAVCSALGVDPLRIFGSGAMLATIPSDETEAAAGTLRSQGITITEIGTVRSGKSGVLLDDELITGAPRDELYELWT